MITADQLLCHAIGDYIFQSDWMANTKAKSSIAAGLHAFTYSFPFLLLLPSLYAMAVIISTHFLIDRFRLARYVNWVKNGPSNNRPITATGYPAERPFWLATWLLIITDNILHVAINGLALRYL